MSVSAGMHRSAPEVGGANTAAVKTSSPETAASATAGERVVGNKACGKQNDCCETTESIPKHGGSSLLI
jgi:hypothetical protein